MIKLKKNQFECPICKEILTSLHNYDLQKCGCGSSAIDGGENLRIIETNIDPERKDILTPAMIQGLIDNLTDPCEIGKNDPWE